MSADTEAIVAAFADGEGMSVRAIAAERGHPPQQVRHILQKAGARFRRYQLGPEARARRSARAAKTVAARAAKAREREAKAREREAQREAKAREREAKAREREARNAAIVADALAHPEWSTVDIAAKHDRSRFTVAAILRAAGKSPAERRDAREQRRNADIVARAKEGETAEDIAALYGLTPHTVLRHTPATRERTVGKRARNADIKARARAGEAVEDIAVSLRMKVATVSGILRAAGVKPQRRAPHARLAHHAAVIQGYVEGEAVEVSALAHGLTPVQVRSIRSNREHSLGKRYGITCADFAALLETQGRVCAICERPFEGHGSQSGAPVVDHDHALGDGNPDAVRGIVHHACNTLIGFTECGRTQEGRTLYRRLGERRSHEADVEIVWRYLQKARQAIPPVGPPRSRASRIAGP